MHRAHSQLDNGGMGDVPAIRTLGAMLGLLFVFVHVIGFQVSYVEDEMKVWEMQSQTNGRYTLSYGICWAAV